MGIDLPKLLAPGTEMLDFGCGHGALSVHAATCGARVTGIDTSRNRIDFAARNLRNFPALQPAIDFICADIAGLPGQSRFDTILSKDTFEHVTSPAEILAAFHRLLRPGGRAYIGFSPLWYSPFGDHGFLTRRKFPWLHLLRGEAPFLAAHNAHTGLNDRTIPEAGFNRQTPADFRTAIAQSGLTLERARINQAGQLKRVAFLPLTLARHVAPIERYATIGMYLTLRK
jgi:SAM-dependent methyltransferase